MADFERDVRRVEMSLHNQQNPFASMIDHPRSYVEAVLGFSIDPDYAYEIVRELHSRARPTPRLPERMARLNEWNAAFIACFFADEWRAVQCAYTIALEESRLHFGWLERYKEKRRDAYLFRKWYLASFVTKQYPRFPRWTSKQALRYEYWVYCGDSDDLAGAVRSCWGPAKYNQQQVTNILYAFHHEQYGSLGVRPPISQESLEMTYPNPNAFAAERYTWFLWIGGVPVKWN